MKEDEGGEDRISELPDALLHHILSLMSLKSAARTSVLSKRWKEIWNSMWAHATCFDFGGEFSSGSHGPQMVAAINRYLLQLHRGNTIEKFCLYIYPRVHYRSDIRRWIRYAAEKGVRELILCFGYSYDRSPVLFKLPYPVFSCDLLAVLRLAECHLYLPKNFKGFPFLKTLSLDSVTIDYNVLESMLLSCPKLEKLNLRRLDYRRLKRERSAPWLKLSSPGLALNRLTVSNFDENIPEIEIHAPGLLSFSFCDYIGRHYSFGDFSSLEEAVIFLPSRFVGGNQIYVFSKISHVKILTISDNTVISYGTKLSNDANSGLPVVYPNLIELQLRMPSSDEKCVKAIYALFKHCSFPSLEKLFIQFPDELMDPPDEEPDECVFTHLKAVKITGFHGLYTEIKLAKFLLGRAVVLESLVLITANCRNLTSSEEKLLTVHKELLLSSKASSNARVVLCKHFNYHGSLHPTHQALGL